MTDQTFPNNEQLFTVVKHLGRMFIKDHVKHGMSVGASGYRDTREIADYLSLSMPKTRQLLNWLSELGLIAQADPIDGRTYLWVLDVENDNEPDIMSPFAADTSEVNYG